MFVWNINLERIINIKFFTNIMLQLKVVQNLFNFTHSYQSKTGIGEIDFFFKHIANFLSINKCNFWANFSFPCSSDGRASDFRSDGPCSNGVPGMKFFFSFFQLKYDTFALWWPNYISKMH